jgi:hypothetical protein
MRKVRKVRGKVRALAVLAVLTGLGLAIHKVQELGFRASEFRGCGLGFRGQGLESVGRMVLVTLPCSWDQDLPFFMGGGHPPSFTLSSGKNPST